jgi:hypothetical protein
MSIYGYIEKQKDLYIDIYIDRSLEGQLKDLGGWVRGFDRAVNFNLQFNCADLLRFQGEALKFHRQPLITAFSGVIAKKFTIKKSCRDFAAIKIVVRVG